MMLEIEKIKRQPDPEHDCGFYAVMNLYVYLGLEPPTIERMRDLCRGEYMTAPEYLGISPLQQMFLLGTLAFPFPFAFGVLPRNMQAQDFFPRLMDAGCAILFGFFFLVNGERWGHSAVAESWTDEGVTALCSGDDFSYVVNWEVVSDAAPTRGTAAHGSRVLVPWRTIGYDVWASLLNSPDSLGIARDFIIVWPPKGN